MKNVLEIFEALDPKTEIRKNLKLTANIFSQKNKRLNLPAHSLKQMVKVIDQLESKGQFTLTNGKQNINFLSLMEIIDRNKIHHLQSTTSLIRSELIHLSNRDSFDQIKPILLFWDGLHCVFSFMQRN